ncbi:hypothetical protein EDB80DRAFT_298301 [Ilyonectria destructans]|nr:hypothetical protein EDB80DRAFT_298301 [Ilyonectria destructans]
MLSLRTSFHKVIKCKLHVRGTSANQGFPHTLVSFFFLLPLQSTMNLNQATGLLVPRFAAMRFHVIALSLLSLSLFWLFAHARGEENLLELRWGMPNNVLPQSESYQEQCLRFISSGSGLSSCNACIVAIHSERITTRRS